MTHEIRLTIAFGPRTARWSLAAALLLAIPIEIGSETLTLSTTYPSPAGVYNQIITTGNGPADTTLNRNGGNTILVPSGGGQVGIGTATPAAGYMLDVEGNIWVKLDGVNSGELRLGYVSNPPAGYYAVYAP